MRWARRPAPGMEAVCLMCGTPLLRSWSLGRPFGGWWCVCCTRWCPARWRHHAGDDLVGVYVLPGYDTASSGGAAVTRLVVDSAALAQAVEDARWARRLTWAEVCRQSGLSRNRLDYVRRGGGASAGVLLSLCAWLGRPAEEFAAECTESAPVQEESLW